MIQLLAIFSRHPGPGTCHFLHPGPGPGAYLFSTPAPAPVHFVFSPPAPAPVKFSPRSDTGNSIVDQLAQMRADGVFL